MVEASVFRHIPKHFDTPYERKRSEDYRVFVNGREVSVYTCRISADPFNRVWPGYQRSALQTEEASFVNLVSDEAFEVEVEPLTKSPDGRVMIKPYSKKIEAERVGNRIRFSLREQGGYVFQIDDYHGMLYLFNNRPVPCENPDGVTYYFGSGVHFPGKITLNSNESVYLEKDALVYGRIYAEQAENIRVYGNGVFDDGDEDRFEEDRYAAYVNGNVKLYDCRNVHLEGVGFTNAAMWCVSMFRCVDVTVDAIRIFGQWRYNTDGVDLVNCQRISIRRSFIHSFDDSVAVKGIDRYACTSCKEILVEDCALWCDWGKTCEIGLETAAREITDVTFRNCDVLRGGNTLCDIQNGDCAEVHGILFEDIRAEFEYAYGPEVYQRTEDQVYSARGEVAVPKIFSVCNRRFREVYSKLGLGAAESELSSDDPRYGGVHGVTVRRIRITCDGRILQRLGGECACIRIRRLHQTAAYEAFTVEDVTLNGVRLTARDLQVRCEGCDDTCLTVR